jgi:drug/metabolite transporter (DMT)-like permease
MSTFRVVTKVAPTQGLSLGREQSDVVMPSSAVGIGCLLLFAVSQGVRDAFFGNVFQSVSFFLVATLAFTTSTVCFSVLALLQRPRDLRKLFGSPAMFAALNVTTAGAWLSFFFGLQHLEPAAVATLYNGVGPLVVLALAAFGWAKGQIMPSRAERLCYAGVAAALAALAVVVLTNRSGLLQSSVITRAVALFAVIAGGITIAISHMIARWRLSGRDLPVA